MGKTQYTQGPPADSSVTLEQTFNSFEVPVIITLQEYLDDQANPPLLTNNEDDLVITDDPTYFDEVSQQSVPRDVLNKLQTGEITREDIARKMQIGRNIVRRTKAAMYTDRLMASVFAADTCRSLYRVATGHEFIQVERNDTVEKVTHRVGDYVTDLLTAGRERRVLRNAAMDRLTGTIRGKFDASPEAARVLTVMAGKNVMKKVGLYVGQLAETSKGFDRMDAATKRKLMEFMASRPLEFQGAPDLVTLLAKKAS